MARVQNSSERVFTDLLEAVVAGRYAPGEKLPRQRELAADLGVTLQPLREALKRLEQVGVVEARHGDATRVRDWRAHGTLDVLAHLGPAVLGDLLEARSLMLREMAGLAAERRDEARGRAIAALAGRFGEAERRSPSGMRVPACPLRNVLRTRRLRSAIGRRSGC